MTKYNFNEYEKDKVSKPRNVAWSNWAKFEKVGDKVQGYIRDVFYKKADGQYKEARCFTLEQPNKELINVSTKRLDFIMMETDDFHLGDPITFELTELKKSDTKGFSPTKIISTFGAKLPENTGKTVKELEAEDMAYGGTIAPADPNDKKFDEITADDVPFGNDKEEKAK